ncbi:MAG: 50S ribosomal protein L35 [Elusimicrobia bacterium]|nr:50S ribosomal protein L35 [Elusimicrobiota bacterium]MBD3411696.1 50S ribosomal protein L35 [Elusimicrobiota bacterium]
MPKLKNHSGTKKRFKKTATGKIKYKTVGQRHLLTGMSAKRGRLLREQKTLTRTDEKTIHRLIPYI